MSTLVEAMCKAIGAGPEALTCEHEFRSYDGEVKTCARCNITPEEAVDLLRAALDLERASTDILKSAIAILSRDRAALIANLTHAQDRGRELLEETREQRSRIHNFDEIGESFERNLGALQVQLDEVTAQRDAFGQKAHQLQEKVQALQFARESADGLLLDGWWCACAATEKSRGIFNSDAKERLTHCRACGAPRPT